MPDVIAQPSAGALRACMSRFPTGVAVVTYETDNGPRGTTMNSLTSISPEPPLVLISVARKARSHSLLACQGFCVNILGAEQEPLALLFAAMSTAAGIPEPTWMPGARVPRLINPLAWVECEPWRCYDGGDHTLVLGRVTDLDHRDGACLTYAWSRFGQISQDVRGIEYLI
jgi:flavin reductase (DIM6/NTAB) family NADH-FMN oxidoreductase RutF